jgi:hypothetical protein
MIVLGGRMPFAPISSASGSALPLLITVIVGAVSSVIVRLVALGLNSVTVPTMLIASPARTVGAVPVNTNTPSEVRALPSPPSWRKKPLVSTPVTMPEVRTCCPAKLERCPSP